MTNSLVPDHYRRVLNKGPLSPLWAQTTGRNSLRQLLFTHVNNHLPGYPPLTIQGTSQQSAVADALSATATTWYQALNNVTTNGHGSVLLQLNAVHHIKTGYWQPYSIASCDVDFIQGHNDKRPVAFPIPPGSSPQMLNSAKFNSSILSSYAFEFPSLSRSQILETPGLSSENRLRWVELPQNPFNGTAIGAIVLLPQDSTNSTQEVIMCNIAAGWGTSTLNISSNVGGPGLVQSQIDIQNLYNASMGYSPKDPYTDISSSPEETTVIRTYGFFDLPMFPQHPIVITEDWAKYLNPFLSNANTTVFKTLMDSNLTEPYFKQTVETILVGMIVNGLSRFVQFEVIFLY